MFYIKALAMVSLVVMVLATLVGAFMSIVTFIMVVGTGVLIALTIGAGILSLWSRVARLWGR